MDRGASLFAAAFILLALLAFPASAGYAVFKVLVPVALGGVVLTLAAKLSRTLTQSIGTADGGALVAACVVSLLSVGLLALVACNVGLGSIYHDAGSGMGVYFEYVAYIISMSGAVASVAGGAVALFGCVSGVLAAKKGGLLASGAALLAIAAVSYAMLGALGFPTLPFS